MAVKHKSGTDLHVELVSRTLTRAGKIKMPVGWTTVSDSILSIALYARINSNFYDLAGKNLR